MIDQNFASRARAAVSTKAHELIAQGYLKFVAEATKPIPEGQSKQETERIARENMQRFQATVSVLAELEKAALTLIDQATEKDHG